MNQKDDIRTIAIEEIRNNNIQAAVFHALELINASTLMQKINMTILIKPNILTGKSPIYAATTHPEIIRAIIHWLQQYHPKQIYICDSSGGMGVLNTKKNMILSQIQILDQEKNVQVIPFERTQRYIYKVEDPFVLSRIISSKLLKEVDLIINVPVIKTHRLLTLTCCIKNMFGTILKENKSKIHALFPSNEKFSSALVDIYSISRPQLSIIDGYLCQEGNGPSHGTIVQMNLIIAGYDPVALDCTVCRIIGINPKKIQYLNKAEQKSLGTMDLTLINYKGKPLHSVYHPFKLPPITFSNLPLPNFINEKIVSKFLTPSVSFDPYKCRLCKTCITSCPAHAITLPSKIKSSQIPQWNKQKCIICYCCVELCPYDAVKFDMNLIRSLIQKMRIGILISSLLILIAGFIFFQ